MWVRGVSHHLCILNRMFSFFNGFIYIIYIGFKWLYVGHSSLTWLAILRGPFSQQIFQICFAEVLDDIHHLIPLWIN